ncbi:MAG TPA: heterodisulfide reductase subunit C [Moorella mulderi]|nr:heterodisulfide reductase subunit C [Moorella mulderi]
MERLSLSQALSSGQAFKERIEAASGVTLSRCYQCGKCTAGCPASSGMDYGPRGIIRLLQLGLYEKAMRSNTPWICAGCQTCYVRCPRDIDMPKLMEAVRQEACRRGIVGDKKTEVFDRAFLRSIERFGRPHEASIMGEYNLLTGQPFKDIMSGPAMLARGKLALLPSRIKNISEIKKIFARVRAKGGEAR